VLSLLSCWNPAELLGTRPRPLSRSLFDRLIGDGIWWRARARLGYRACPSPSIALLQPVQGRPYVDVRRSANSLLPAGLAVATQERLVDAWLERLLQAPELHDKVEFAVFRTARDFTADRSVARAWAPVVGAEAQCDWEQRLAALTQALMQDTLDGRHRDRLLAMQASQPRALDWRDALARCAGGTEEFAMLARAAFVAEAQLRSAVEREALSPVRAQALRGAIDSVASLTAPADADAWHLRPGSFDITRPVCGPAQPRVTAPAARFELRGGEARRLRRLLAEAGFRQDVAEWLRFVMYACRAREWGKFVFTRHLSAALEAIAREFEALGLGREEASWVALRDIEASRVLPAARRRVFLAQQAALAVARHERERATMLSPILAAERDAWVADSLGVLPNFIGAQTVSGPLVALDGPTARADLRDAVVVLRNADPGYDFVFSHRIRGLITAWGGAHSHMAIRCAEFGLSAAIGCGEAVFQRALRATHARIDPLQGSIWLDEPMPARRARIASA